MHGEAFFTNNEGSHARLNMFHEVTQLTGHSALNQQSHFKDGTTRRGGSRSPEKLQQVRGFSGEHTNASMPTAQLNSAYECDAGERMLPQEMTINNQAQFAASGTTNSENMGIAELQAEHQRMREQQVVAETIKEDIIDVINDLKSKPHWQLNAD